MDSGFARADARFANTNKRVWVSISCRTYCNVSASSVLLPFLHAAVVTSTTAVT